MPAIEIPERPPLHNQDITITRCLTCGAILPGTWGIHRADMQAATDHILTRHRADLNAGRVPIPPFANCTIFDPFWFDEHVPEEADRA